MLTRPSYINPANYSIQDAWAGAQVAPDPMSAVCTAWDESNKEPFRDWLKRHYFDPYVTDMDEK